MPASPPANADRIIALLGPDSSWRVRCIRSTGSTNFDMAAAARRGEAAGAVLVAEHQDAGRGRFERTWTSPPGVSVATSVLLRPRRPALDWGWLSLLVGLAVADGIRGRTFNSIPLYLAAFLYLILVAGMAALQKRMEKRLARSDRG